jgi:murein DD-endopeptidase MepM/ murein hydrolase activator NlpD
MVCFVQGFLNCIMRKHVRIGFIFFAFLLTACGAMAAHVATPTLEPTPTFTPTAPTATVTPQPTITATPTMGVQSPTPTPLRINFPTPQEEPVSIWRPPLYQQPFALSPHDHFYFARPIAVDAVNWPLADYRYGYYFPDTNVVHTGIDIDAPLSTPILAAASGRVVWAGYGLLYHNNDSGDPYGLAVAIRHDFGYHGQHLTTVYAHMSRVDVRVGQTVKQGDQLGLVGMTGNTTGPHVHFEVRLEFNSTISTRNPELWLAPPEGDGVIAGRVMRTNGLVLQNYRVVIVSNSGDSWVMYTYASNAVNSDDYYHENMALGDLPAGEYEIYITFEGTTYEQDLIVRQGAISYFTFQGARGFNVDLPPEPDITDWLIPFKSQ